MNFSCQRIAIRSNRANHGSCNLASMVEELSLELHEDKAPNNVGTTIDVRRPSHVTTYKETEWHISRQPKTLTKAYFA